MATFSSLDANNRREQENFIEMIDGVPGTPKNIYKDDLMYAVYGPFYRILTFSGFFLATKNSKKIVKFFTFLPTILITGLNFSRAIYLFIQFKKAESLTLLWCYIVPLSFLALHNLLSTFTIISYNKKKYFNKLIDLLLRASNGKIQPYSKRSLLNKSLGFILFILFLYMFAMFIFENLFVYQKVDGNTIRERQFQQYYHDSKDIIYPQTITSAMVNDTVNKLNNDYEPFRLVMFGGQAIFPLDIIIILLGTYMSSMAFITCCLSMRELSDSYDEFNKEIKELVRNNRLNSYSEIMAIENRVMDYNKLAVHIYNADKTTISMTIMIGLIVQGISKNVPFFRSNPVHMSAQFGMRAYSNGMPAPTAVVLVNWTILGIILFIPFMLRPIMFYGKTTKTIQILLEEKSIIGQSQLEISYVLDRIIMRLERADFAKHILVPVKSCTFTIKGLLFIIMFSVEILAAYWKKI